jgi:hypothetical protein
MKRFFGFFFGTVFVPARAFTTLQTDRHALSKGLRAIVAVGVLFAVTSGMLAVGGALVAAPPLLTLSGENYYVYQTIFALPVFFMAWMLAGLFARAFGRWRHGHASLHGTLAALGFAFAIPALAAWIPQTVFAVLTLLGMTQEEFMDLTAQPGIQRTMAFAVQGLVVVWTLSLSAVAVRAGLRLRWAKAVPLGILTGALFLGCVLVFIR